MTAPGQEPTSREAMTQVTAPPAPDVTAVPGTKRVRHLEENAAAADVTLTAGELAALDEAVPRGAVAGERYDAARLAQVDV